MFLDALNILGICVAATTGAIAAGRKKMDFFGVMVVACITALGGGTVRDVLLDTYPVSWVNHPEYLLYTSACALGTIFIAHVLITRRIMTLFLILDALGLSSFVIFGTEKALAMGLSPSIAVVSGMLSGISGGVLRDIICNDIPLVLQKELYAMIALGGAVLFIVLDHFHVAYQVNMLITVATIFGTRLGVIFFPVEMPKFDFAKNLKKRRR